MTANITSGSSALIKPSKSFKKLYFFSISIFLFFPNSYFQQVASCTPKMSRLNSISPFSAFSKNPHSVFPLDGDDICNDDLYAGDWDDDNNYEIETTTTTTMRKFADGIL